MRSATFLFKKIHLLNCMALLNFRYLLDQNLHYILLTKKMRTNFWRRSDWIMYW